MIGEANAELLKFMSKTLGVRKSDVVLGKVAMRYCIPVFSFQLAAYIVYFV